MTEYYIMVDGEPQAVDDVVTWARWMEDNKTNKHVALTKIAPGIEISTVFLHLDHSFGDGPPVLFETMVFGGDYSEQEQERYCTVAQARRGHAAMVAKIIGKLTEGKD